MPVDEEASKVDRYAWPGAEEKALEVTCARVARHLALARPGTVGFLPVGVQWSLHEPRAVTLAPLLSRIAGALIGFVSDDVAIVDSWTTWTSFSSSSRDAAEGGAKKAVPDTRRDAGQGDTGASSRIREIQPRVLEVMPPACHDATAAAAALRNTLTILRRSVSIVLVDLGGYAASGVVPSTLNLVDGVVMVVSARRTRKSAVARLAEQLPTTKQLGAILVG